MKTLKFLISLFTFLNIYAFLSYFKRYNSWHLSLIDRFIYDYVWFIISPILVFMAIGALFIYLLYNKNLINNLNLFYKILVFINFLVSAILCYFSILFWNAATDGGLFQRLKLLTIQAIQEITETLVDAGSTCLPEEVWRRHGILQKMNFTYVM